MKKAFCIGLFAFLLLSCDRFPTGEGSPLVLGVDAPLVDTRAPSTGNNLLTTVFSVGDDLGVFLEPTVRYGAAAKTFRATSVTSPITLFQGYPDDVFFPGSGTVDIYAFHPASVVSSDIRTSTVDFTVASDQSSRADYAASDLMYGSATGVARTASPVPVTMNHALSRLTLRFSAGTATAAEQTAILAQLANSTITMDGTVHTRIEGFNLGSPAGAYTVSLTNGAPVTFATGTNVAFYSAAGDPEYSVILPPQTLPASTTITVAPSGGSSVYGSFLADLVLEKGKEAVITLTVVKRTLTIACIELVPWPGTPTTGTVVF